MKSVIIITVLFVGACLYTQTEAIDIKCGGVDMKITEEHMMGIQDCLKSVGAAKFSDLSPSMAGCLSKCIMEKRGLVDAAGKPHKENVMKAIDDNLPPTLVEPWKKAMEKCLDTEGTKIVVPDDDQCSSYLPLTMCSHMAFINICAT